MVLLGPVKIPVETSEDEHSSLKPKRNKPFIVESICIRSLFKRVGGRFVFDKKLERGRSGKFPSLDAAMKSADNQRRHIESCQKPHHTYGGEITIKGPGVEKKIHARFLPKIGIWDFGEVKIPASTVFRDQNKYDWEVAGFNGYNWLMPRLNGVLGVYIEIEKMNVQG